MEKNEKLNVKTLSVCGLFAALIALGAFIKIPVPYVPFTLQTLFVILAGLLLGSKRGLIAVGTYVILGLIGLPIFTSGGGIGYVLTPTFGYLVGFVIGVFLIGYLCERAENPGFKQLFLYSLAGLGIIYAVGIVYFTALSNLYLGNNVGLITFTLYNLMAFAPGDIVLTIFAVVLAIRLKPALRHLLKKE
jgi:biotin transport system substrate-specific component